MPNRANPSRALLAILAVGVTLGCAGCLRNKVQAAAPVAFAPQPETERPMNVAPDTDASPPQPAEASAPTIPPNSNPPPVSSIPKIKAPPAPPKPAIEQPSTEPAAEASSHPPAPQIFPQLSPGEQQIYERNTNDELNVAERNLQQANGRQLNAVQQDLLKTARSYIEQAREASKGGDWARAQNLAHKARLASDDLVNSL
jgi:hypothetical protein